MSKNQVSTNQVPTNPWLFQKQWRQWLVVMASVAVLVAVAFQVSTVFAAGPGKKVKTLHVDVAQDMLSFRADEAPVFTDGMPANGNPFMIQGFIYPAGTLTNGNGIIITTDEDGSQVAAPEFPDKVLGMWTCRGYFVGDGLHTSDGAWAVSTQFFAFGDEFGSETLVSEGYELPSSLTETLHRAITGGTGIYAGAEGTQVQGRIGANATGASNFSIEFQLIK